MNPVFSSFDRPLPMAMGEYTTGDASIFWDVKDSSILLGLNTHSIFQNFKSALENKSYCGYLSIRAYVDELTLPKEFINKCDIAGIQISLVPQGDRYFRILNILFDMINWALKRRVMGDDNRSAIATPSTLLIVSENIKEDHLFSKLCFRCFSPVKDLYNIIISTPRNIMEISQTNEEQIIASSPGDHNVFIIGGPSGAGRDAVIKRLREVRKGLHFVVTTSCSKEMEMREDYYFVPEHQFLKMVDRSDLLRYNVEKGISKQEIRESLARGEDIVLKAEDVIEVGYLMAVLASAVFIYLVSQSDLSTPVESEEALVSLAREEAWHVDYDYIVVHAEGKLDEAVNSLESIIDAEKSDFGKKLAVI